MIFNNSAIGRKSFCFSTGLNQLWENFVFATLAFAYFAYATLEFDISLLPLLVFDNTSQKPFRDNTSQEDD